MKAPTRRFYFVLIGAALVAIGQVPIDLQSLRPSVGIEAWAQAPLPPMPSESRPMGEEPLPPPAPPMDMPGVPPPDSPALTLPEAPPGLEPSPSAELDLPHPPAKTLKEIEIQKQPDAVNIVLKGDGQFTYQVSPLKNRLVVDLEDVINGTKMRTVTVAHPLLKQIRIASHLQPLRKLRLVFDLSRSVPYTVEKMGDQLLIALNEPSTAQTPVQESDSAGSPEKAREEKPLVRPITPKPSMKTQEPGPSVAPLFTTTPKAKPSVSVLEPAERYTGKRISLDFQDAEISSVLRLIADVSGFNMVVGEGAKAKVTLKLINVPWDQALELILKLNQLGQIREGNIIWIDSLANIAKQKDDAVRAYEATVKAEPLGTRIMYLNYADANKTLDIVKSNLSSRGEVKVDGRQNALVVKDIAEHLRKVDRLLRDLDRVTPQVQIEARIVQASKAFARGIGVQWGISGISSQVNPLITTGGIALPGQHQAGPVVLNLGRTGAAFTTGAASGAFLVDLPSTTTGVNIPTSALGLTIGRFLGTTGTLDLRLSAGESLGITKIVSAPKIITLDNKPAKIEQGSQVPFQTTSLQGTQTTFVDATLTLNVTPHVIPFAQTIRLEIKATKNSVGAAVSTAGPTIDKKEATTEVLLKDGETTVLGGIFEDNRSDTTRGIPWFNRIPFLGWLFKTEGVALTQTELLVFVTPIILKD